MLPSQTYGYNRLPSFPWILQQPAYAFAEIKGSPNYPAITGSVQFYQTAVGVLVSAQIIGLPVSEEICKDQIFAFHIHDGSSCTGTAQDPFANVLTHYNPLECPHPQHAGDLPPLWGNHGYAFQVFLTDRFSTDEIIGKTIVIHRNPDDFSTQPAGNAGEKIACGEIRRNPFRKENSIRQQTGLHHS